MLLDAAVQMRPESILLISVGVWLERSSSTNAKVIGLCLCHLSEVCTKNWQMQAGNPLIKLFWKQVHIVLVGLGFLPVLQNVKLGKHLVGEGERHDERRMACRTA